MNGWRPQWTKGIAALLLAAIAGVALLATLGAGPPEDPPGQGDPTIVPLGRARDRDGSEVEGMMIIHFAPGFAQRADARNGGGAGAKQTTCYKYIWKDHRWRATEGYLFDITNNQGLDGATLRSLMSTALETWDTQVAFDVFGAEGAGAVDGVETLAPDGKNEVVFGNAAAYTGSTGTIAFTVVWRNLFTKSLVEWDMLFDQTTYLWSLTGEAGKMDFWNVATHEGGHATNMHHPGTTCTEETMYAYAAYGETKKRDLNTGDITGITKLYSK